jgi:hypothetical protein
VRAMDFKRISHKLEGKHASRGALEQRERLCSGQCTQQTLHACIIEATRREAVSSKTMLSYMYASINTYTHTHAHTRAHTHTHTHT